MHYDNDCKAHNQMQEGIGSEWFVNVLVIINFNHINMTSKIYSVIICYCL